MYPTRIGVESFAYWSTNTLSVLLSVPTNLVFVGASNGPSVVRANAEVVADCSTVKIVGETTT